MPKTDAFETHADRYEAWFEKYPAAYESELRMPRSAVDIAGGERYSVTS